MEKYLPIQDCKHGYLYEIDSRNLRLGVYNENTKSFYGIRYKFGDRFIDDEFHWDLNEPYGTCKPIRELEVCPIEFTGELSPIAEGEYKEHSIKWRHQKITNYDQLFNWLDQKLKAAATNN
jgi:hypothetical protein